ncbi:hypothetical protein, partial [Bacillus thuringiensis]|uniref:hypothetical protein n=1 Tax=Bacillus thuringiensis TaxID=1428 RepID=UPI0005B45A66
ILYMLKQAKMYMFILTFTVNKTIGKINPNLTKNLAIQSKKLTALIETLDKFKEKYEGWLEDE